MSAAPVISRFASASVWFGVGSVLLGVFSVTVFEPGWLIGFLALAGMAVVSGIIGLAQIGRAPENRKGKSRAWWGIALPVGFFVLAALLIPAT